MLGEGRPHAVRALTLRLASLGLGAGALASATLFALEQPLPALFTRSAHVASLVRDTWPLLAALQPINALVFVYDGLLYATQSFRYIRNALALGVALVFAPSLAAARMLLPSSLVAVWGAKAALNTWRCLTALARIHLALWPTWREPTVSAPLPAPLAPADVPPSSTPADADASRSTSRLPPSTPSPPTAVASIN